MKQEEYILPKSASDLMVRVGEALIVAADAPKRSSSADDLAETITASVKMAEDIDFAATPIVDAAIAAMKIRPENAARDVLPTMSSLIELHSAACMLCDLAETLLLLSGAPMGTSDVLRKRADGIATAAMIGWMASAEGRDMAKRLNASGVKAGGK